MSQILTEEKLKSNFEDFLMQIEKEKKSIKNQFNNDLISKIFIYDNDTSEFKVNEQIYPINSQHKIHFLFNPNKENYFVARYVLALETTFKMFDEYKGILKDEIEQNFKDKMININCKSNEILEEFVKNYGYCEFSHKEQVNNQPNVLIYKSRILLCSSLKKPKEALNLILDMYNEHKEVLNIGK